MRIRTYRRRVTAALAISLVPLLLAPWHAAADPARTVRITVHSEAMDRDIPLEVILPADTSAPRPTLYLLNGAGGGEDSATWEGRTDVLDFFADKNVNVVTPLEGAFSYYTDWQKDDPVLGRNKWQTFLTRELPPVIDAQFGTNGGQLHRGDLDDRDLGTQSRDLGTRALSECRGLQRVRGDFHPAWSGLRAPGGRCAGRR